MWLPKVWLGKDQSALEAFIRKCRFLGPILVLLNLILWSVAQESEYLTNCLVPPLHAQVWKALWPSAALVFRQSNHDGCYFDLCPALGFLTQCLRSEQLVQKTILARLLNQVSASASKHFFWDKARFFSPLFHSLRHWPLGRGIRKWRTLLPLKINFGYLPGLWVFTSLPSVLLWNYCLQGTFCLQGQTHSHLF